MFRSTIQSRAADFVHQARMKAKARTCPCGGERQSGHIVCRECWRAAGFTLQANYRSLGTRSAATKQLIEFAKSRNPNHQDTKAQRKE